MSSNTATTLPNVPQVQADNIPGILKGLSQWIVWRAGLLKANGKFDKIPVDPRRGRKINAHDPNNWLSFDDAIAAHRAGVGSGIGIVMSAAHTVERDGEPHYLVALDFDRCGERMNEMRETWMQLGQPYVEMSPSRKGLRMLGLCNQVLRSGNSGNGVEVYFDKQFVTVTGADGRGEVKDVTAGLVTLHQQWFSPQVTQQPQAPQTNGGLLCRTGSSPTCSATRRRRRLTISRA
jgi:primase-polymerase (primpol)-like protein